MHMLTLPCIHGVLFNFQECQRPFQRRYVIETAAKPCNSIAQEAHTPVRSLSWKGQAMWEVRVRSLSYSINIGQFLVFKHEKYWKNIKCLFIGLVLTVVNLGKKYFCCIFQNLTPQHEPEFKH